MGERSRHPDQPTEEYVRYGGAFWRREDIGPGGNPHPAALPVVDALADDETLTDRERAVRIIIHSLATAEETAEAQGMKQLVDAIRHARNEVETSEGPESGAAIRAVVLALAVAIAASIQDAAA